MSYNLAKSIHLAGLIIWLGIPTGGYFLMLAARLEGDASIFLWALREYLGLVHIEAFGLVLLILSGLKMRSEGPFKSAAWLKKKLFIVFSVFAPFEAVQIIIYRFYVEKAFATGEGLGAAITLYDRFSIISFITLALTVPVVFWLAVFKPRFPENRP